MTDELQKAAEILVECGYALKYGETKKPMGEHVGYWLSVVPDDTYIHEYLDPFSDTLEGRRQADAIEDWLWIKQTSLWDKSFHHIERSGDGRKTRLGRIKWCLQELNK